MAARNTPDPLKSGHIQGQHPATPERMPGHTGYYAEAGDPGPNADLNGRPAFLFASGDEIGVTLDASGTDLPRRSEGWQLSDYVSLAPETAERLGVDLHDLVATLHENGIYVRRRNRRET